MKSFVFGDMSYSQVKVNRRFGGTYLLHFQDQGVSQARKSREAGRKESHSRKKYIPPKLRLISVDYTTLHPRR
jgi:hypothetical protein